MPETGLVACFNLSHLTPMYLLFKVLYAKKCTSTHHKVAMDALRYLRADNDEDWVRLFLAEIEQYTDGAKAPDKKFKDFRNHVLHVSDNYWGGAVQAAELWYGRLVDRLKAQDWARAVYCAGVLSHYVTDPLMPLHTGQTEDEGQVHKFIEWGTSKIYEDLVATHETARTVQNWKPPAVAGSEDWLMLVIRRGAHVAHKHYDVMIDHYDPALGKKNAASGFDATCRASLSVLLGWSIKAFAFVLDQAIAEANVVPPKRKLTVTTVLSGLSTPVFWITRKLADRKDRQVVKAIWDELQATGKVIHALPEDDRTIRAAHAEEVLGISTEQLDPQAVRPAGSKHASKVSEDIDQDNAQSEVRESPQTAPMIAAQDDGPDVTETNHAIEDEAINAAQVSAVEAEGDVEADAVDEPLESNDAAGRAYLDMDSPVVDAPSIGPKTARRLKKIEIETVEELLEADPVDASDQLQQRWITVDVFTDWQRQASLVCDVPGLRGHDAQLLVGVGILRPDQLRDSDVDDLLERVTEFCQTSEGERILRGGAAPDRDEIERWIGFTDDTETAQAA